MARNSDKADVFRIISFDGGGIRGLLSVCILERLLAEVPALLENTHLFAGTSTGGLIALALADNFTPSELIELYIQRGPEIFGGRTDPLLRVVTDGFRKVEQLMFAPYSTETRRQVFAEYLENRTLGELRSGKRVLIPAFSLNGTGDFAGKPKPGQVSWRTKFFHNFPHDRTGSDQDCLAVDVACATSAAPTFFPSYKHFVDGGVVVNNPAMSAVAQMLDELRVGPEVRKLDELRLLSIGTGTIPHMLSNDNDWGDLPWVLNRPGLIDILLDTGSDVVDYHCRQLLTDERYQRLNPVLPDGIPATPDGAVSKADMAKLVKCAAEMDLHDAICGSDTVSWLKENWAAPARQRPAAVN